MIYEFPSEGAPIRQGDIFTGVPRIDILLNRVRVLSEDDRVETTSWDEVRARGQPVVAVCPARPVIAIVASQDCDAARAPDITLCEVREFQEVEGKSKGKTSPEKLMRVITQHARINQKWFYLPPDPKIGFRVKMAADFMVPIRIARQDLEGLRHLRVGRLNEYGEAHFRERIAEFFRRYPYDEWYALDREEMDAYLKDHPDAQACPWQQASFGDASARP